jgi:ectoine hydroxylase-related dioxygenase (phytanoyl-CoA dioxygenase family)
MLTNEQKHQFKDKGYLHIKSFYPQSDMARISQWINQIENDDTDPGYKYYDTHHSDESRSVLTRIERFLLNHNALDTLVWSPLLQAVFSNLLGSSPAIFKDKINFKLPGGKADLLHQDHAAGWGTYTDYFVSVAIFVDENTKENAAMSVLRTGDYPKDLMNEEWTLLNNSEPPFEPADHYELLEGNPGDIVFFDSYVPHGSPINTSSKRRRNIFITVNPESAGHFRDAYYTDKLKTYPPNNLRDDNKKYIYKV